MAVGTNGRMAEQDAISLQGALRDNGFSYIRGLPASCDHASLFSFLGEVIPQYNGVAVREVRPEADMEGIYSVSNLDALSPHTEGYEFPTLPARYVVLWAVQPAAGPGGETTLADGYAYLEGFSPQDRRRLSTDLYAWRSNVSLERRGVELSRIHPALEHQPDGLVMHYCSRDILRTGDPLQSRYVDEGLRFFADHHVAVAIEKDAVLVWDNWRMMHARNAFTDPRRHLRRVLLGDVRLRS
ncbi:TauD/TfdA family dioxygenase [Streptomyces sp. NPDC057638]|uniref:TauD/TfdA family dioxygenase n=1 Tax=Streptomyces sp. NPDC057638 TaxID=3346190 RepID=UPI0036D17B37